MAHLHRGKNAVFWRSVTLLRPLSVVLSLILALFALDGINKGTELKKRVPSPMEMCQKAAVSPNGDVPENNPD